MATSLENDTGQWLQPELLGWGAHITRAGLALWGGRKQAEMNRAGNRTVIREKGGAEGKSGKSSSVNIYVKIKKRLHSISDLDIISQVLEIKQELLRQQRMSLKALGGSLHCLCLHCLRESDRAPRSGRRFWTMLRSWDFWKPEKEPQSSPQCCLPHHSRMGKRPSPSPFPFPSSRVPQAAGFHKHAHGILTVELKNLYILGGHALFPQSHFLFVSVVPRT